ncbi:MAG TPA: radical SAM protein [Abditibacteriaceae bacterium]|jgi:MoaA/NifB/PqqE/SkfB family radical SAM enzyme
MSSHAVKMVKGIGLRMLRDNPGEARALAGTFVPWYLQNRVRAMILPWEQQVWGRADGRSQNPRFITIKPTFRCNLRCEFCRFVANGQVFGKADYFLDDEWMKLVDEVAPYKPYFSITGGEPLLYPRIGELLGRIKHHGMHAAMVTNATLLERKAEEIMEAPPASLQVSIDGPRDTHDKLRMVDGTFDKAQRGLQKLLELKARKGSALPVIVINSVITGSNYHNMPAMTQVAAELGASIINFQHFWFMTRPMADRHNHQWGDCMPMDADDIGTTETSGVNADELFEAMREAERVSPIPTVFYPELNLQELDTYYNDPETFIRPRPPGCAWLQTAIFPNGDVSPCFNHVVGNIREKPFMEIWNGPEMRDHRMRLANDGPYSVCARCCAYFRYD